jgi:hypothetical protein
MVLLRMPKKLLENLSPMRVRKIMRKMSVWVVWPRSPTCTKMWLTAKMTGLKLQPLTP